MAFDNIVVLGAGVIGSCYGALLSKRNRVIMVDNDKENVERINKQGIEIITNRKRNFALKAQTNLKKILPNTLILLTTKAHQIESALSKIRARLRNDTVILVLQNGLGNEDLVKKIVGNRGEVIRGIVNSGAWAVRPGCYNLILREIVLEPSPKSDQIAQIFNRAGLPTRIAQDFPAELWRKVVLNCVVNPLTAILQIRNNQIGSPILRNLRHQIVEECLKVSKAEGVFLPTNLAETLDEAILGYTNFSSMYQDVKNRKKTEIDFLNGKIVELAKRHNIPVPINETLTAIIKFFETSAK